MTRTLYAALAIFALPVTPAAALPIAAGSELSLNGSDTFTPTSITFISTDNVGGESGSFAELINCTGCATMNSFTSTTANFELYSVTDGAFSSTLTTTGLPSFAFTPGTLETLVVSGTGTLTLTGFDPTPGSYEITTQGPGGAAEVTFSASSIAAAPVSEPSSMAILAGAVLAAAWWYRRRARS